MSYIRNTNRIKPRGLIQASSHKLQALELDNSQNMGYSRTITDGNARLAQPNAGPSTPPGSKPIKDLMKAVASPEVGTLKNKNLKHQAPKDLRRIYEAEAKAELQASSPKHKGSSTKPQAASSLIRDPRNI